MTSTFRKTLSLSATLLLSSVGFIGAEATAQTAAEASSSTAETVARSFAFQQLSPAQIEADVTLARNAYRDIHPGYDRYTDQATLDAAWDELLVTAQKKDGMDEGRFYLAISEILALIRCDHTKAELNKPMKEMRRSNPIYLPMKWQIVEGRALVMKDDDQRGLKKGDEILSIDGRTITELSNELLKFIPYDGHNTHIREAQMAASLEFMGGAVDHFGSLLWGMSKTATLQIKSATHAEKTVKLPRVNHTQWASIAIDRDSRNFKDSTTLTRIGDRSAILTVNSFVNYRQPVEPDSIYGPIFDQLKAEGRDQLILDLRRNGGGSTDASQGLFAYLIDNTRRMKTAQIMRTLDHSDYDPYISTWDRRAINPPRISFRKTDEGEYALRAAFTEDTDRITPAKFAFKGDLTILTSRDNSSGSTNLISAIRAARPVTLIGEQTGGNPAGVTAGSIFFLKLPESGLTLRIPVFRFVNNSGDVEDGVGLMPDIAAPTTVETIRAGTDPALEAALRRLAHL